MSSGLRDHVRSTLGLRLAVWYAALFLAGTLVLFALTHALLARSLEQRDREAVRLALAEYASEYATSGPAGLVRTLTAQEQLGAHVDLFVRAIDRRRGIRYLSQPGRWTDFDLDAPVPSPQPRTYVWSRLASQSGDNVLEVASMSPADGVVLQVGRSDQGRHEVLERFRDLLGALLGATVVIGLAAGSVLTRRALRPVNDLARMVDETVRTGRLDARVEAREGGDALDALGRDVNAMLDRIESLVTAMREALDAVAHDLRTPLMRLRVAAETALQGEADAASCRESLSDCLEETERVQAMLDSLMDLSEAEAGTMALHRQAIPVRSLLEDTLSLFGDMAEDRKVELRIAEPVDHVVDGDLNRLRQVLANLVDNALKHTPPGGQIILGSQAEGDQVALTVTDTGEGIAPGDLPRIWDRLFRGDRSRSKRGLGLGLSLVRAIAEAHGGRVEVHSAPAQGARFTVHLPGPRA
jgi:signal transduction histidine kinase